MQLEGEVSSFELLGEVDESLGEIYLVYEDGRRGAFDHLSQLLVALPN